MTTCLTGCWPHRLTLLFPSLPLSAVRHSGQFFDHVLPPIPPRNDPTDGKSTVSTTGELTREVRWGIPAGHPIGLGFRVPAILISPWTRGGKVFSAVSDHTSVIQFLEQVFPGVHCPNISPWRRAVTSDLVAAFDFDHPDMSWPSSWPSTKNNVNMSEWQCEHLPQPVVPTTQSMPVQAPGTRPLRPLPYNTSVTAAVNGSTVAVTMSNAGSLGVVLYVFDHTAPSAVPRKFTVTPGHAITDEWVATSFSTASYNLSAHAANGFVRTVAGTTAAQALSASFAYDASSASVVVGVSTASPGATAGCAVDVVDNAYGNAAQRVAVPGSASVAVAASGHWYDVTVSVAPSADDAACALPVGSFVRRYMGHVDIPEVTTTDPAMATGKSPFREAGDRHPPMHASVHASSQWRVAKECGSRRSRMKDACWMYDVGAEYFMSVAQSAVQDAEPEAAVGTKDGKVAME